MVLLSSSAVPECRRRCMHAAHRRVINRWPLLRFERFSASPLRLFRRSSSIRRSIVHRHHSSCWPISLRGLGLLRSRRARPQAGCANSRAHSAQTRDRTTGGCKRTNNASFASFAHRRAGDTRAVGMGDSDSEDDVPLAQRVKRAETPAKPAAADSEGSDDDVPLAERARCGPSQSLRRPDCEPVGSGAV